MLQQSQDHTKITPAWLNMIPTYTQVVPKSSRYISKIAPTLSQITEGHHIFIILWAFKQQTQHSSQPSACAIPTSFRLVLMLPSKVAAHLASRTHAARRCTGLMAPRPFCVAQTSRTLQSSGPARTPEVPSMAEEYPGIAQAYETHPCGERDPECSS